MGIFTNYKKEYQSLETEVKAYIKEQDVKFADLKIRAEKFCRKYNDEIPVINSVRSQLRGEIADLYDFLKKFGNIGEMITILDFAVEETMGVNSVQSNNGFDFEKKEDSKFYKFSKFATGVLCTTNPVFVPGLIFLGVHDRNNHKKNYENLLLAYEKVKVENEKKLEEAKDLVLFFVTAQKIAELYRNAIITVKDSIQKTIYPELKDIRAFLYADAIAQKIYSGEYLQGGVIPTDIKELEDTKYNEHFLFVKNACDYYNLITTLFTEKILTKIFEDKKITKDEYDTFKEQVEHFYKQKEILESLSTFN